MPKQNIEECELTEGGVFFPALVWSDAYLIQMPTIAGLQRLEKNFGLSQSSKGEVIRSRQRI